MAGRSGCAELCSKWRGVRWTESQSRFVSAVFVCFKDPRCLIYHNHSCALLVDSRDVKLLKEELPICSIVYEHIGSRRIKPEDYFRGLRNNNRKRGVTVHFQDPVNATNLGTLTSP